MPEYSSTGRVDITAAIDTSNLVGKTAIVTGGASGIGEGYVRTLVSAGCFVCIGDLNSERGASLAAELPRTCFVRVDVTNWDDQVRLFKTAAEELAPDGRISYVVANAGITKADTVYEVAGEGEPIKPDLQIIDVNIVGSLYTTKLALHYFAKQNGVKEDLRRQQDTCLVLIGSGAAFLDCLRAPQYQASKWAMRGVMHSLRRTMHFIGSRVNLVSPWYIRSGILTKDQFDGVEKLGVQLALLEDAQKALLRICSDVSVNGRNLFISPRKWREQGYWDMNIDDYHEMPEIENVQQEQMWGEPASLGFSLK